MVVLPFVGMLPAPALPLFGASSESTRNALKRLFETKNAGRAPPQVENLSSRARGALRPKLKTLRDFYSGRLRNFVKQLRSKFNFARAKRGTQPFGPPGTRTWGRPLLRRVPYRLGCRCADAGKAQRSARGGARKVASP